MNKTDNWNSQERRMERKARLDGLKKSNGSKKPIESKGKFAKIFFPILAVVVVLALAVFAVLQFAILQKLFPPMKIDGNKVSAAEYSYTYNGVLQGLDIDVTTEEGNKKLKELTKLEGYENKTWMEYARNIAAEQISEQHILYQLALDADLSLDEEEITQVNGIFDDLIKQMGSKVEADKYLMEMFGKSVTISSLKPVFEKYWLANKFTAEKMDSFEISDEEIKTVYNKNKDDYDTVTFRLAYFSLEKGDSDKDEDAEKAKLTEETKKKAQNFLDKVVDEESFRELAEQKTHDEEKAAYEEMSKDEKVEADAKKEKEKKETEELLATMTDEEKEEYESSEANKDMSIIYSMSKEDLVNANEKMAEWLFNSDRKAGDKEVFDFGTGFYAIYFVLRDSEYSFPAVRHILISPNEEKDVQAGDSFTKDEWNAARDKANKIMGEISSKDDFISAVKEHSTDPGSLKTDGLYENITRGQMMPTFNDWSFDESRKEGDMGLVRTPYGYHIMWYEKLDVVSSMEKNKEEIAAGLKEKSFESFLEAQKEEDRFQYEVSDFGVKIIQALG